jgi:DNA polymerase alpha subunit A
MPVNVGDHIPYIICKAEEGAEVKSGATGYATRAHHPTEIEKSNGALQVDLEWYLGHQILPPLARICDPIEGTSGQMLAQQVIHNYFCENFNVKCESMSMGAT